ncbi:MAG: fimbrillin family protein, partial [Bacteroidaceae bacterium]
MKKIILFLLISCPLYCLISCNSDSVVDDVKTPLRIMVDIDPYSQANGEVMLRRANNGVFTTFEEGDDFGLIVVDELGNLVADNYRYVVQKSGLGYRVDNSGNVISSDIYSNANYTYLAYSPYDSRYNGYTSLDAIIETHKTLLTSDYADQSTAEIYNKADLLVCKDAKPLGTTLRLSFTHAMGL